MYENETINGIIECIDNYDDAFMNRGNQLTVLGTFLLLVDKFELDKALDCDFTEKEYDKYFKDTTKKYNKPIHKIIKKEFKKGHKTK